MKEISVKCEHLEAKKNNYKKENKKLKNKNAEIESENKELKLKLNESKNKCDKFDKINSIVLDNDNE